jgi:hypothetical protein
MPTWTNRDRFFQIFWVRLAKTFLVRQGQRRGGRRKEDRELFTFAAPSRAKKEYRSRVAEKEAATTWKRVPAPSAPVDDVKFLPDLGEAVREPRRRAKKA